METHFIRRTRARLLAALMGPLFLGCLGGAPSQTAGPATGRASGKVSGRITYKGPAVEPRVLRVHGDALSRVWPNGIPEESLGVGPDLGIRDAVVWLSEVPSGEPRPRPEPFTLYAKWGTYVPRVFMLRSGQEVRVRGMDGFPNKPITYKQGETEAVQPRELGKGVISGAPGDVWVIKCDIHPTMKSYAVVLDSPHAAITGPSGEYSFEGLPPGRYKVHVWHERFGASAFDVDLSEGESERLDREYK